MANIFISYAREDIGTAEAIYELFKGKGHTVWVDFKNLVPGQEWKIEIEKAIQSSDVFVACLSTNSVDKVGYVQKELRSALDFADLMPEGRIYIIPVRLDVCNVPTKLKDLHWVDYFETGSAELLLRAVQEHPSKPKNQTFLINAHSLIDELREGPCLISIVPIQRSLYSPIEWISRRYKLTLCCEHSLLPLPVLNGSGNKKGVYEFEALRMWFKWTVPYLKIFFYSLLALIIIATVLLFLVLDDATFKAIQNQLVLSSVITGLVLFFLLRAIDISMIRDEQYGQWLGGEGFAFKDPGKPIRIQQSDLRRLHAFLRSRDPGFGGLVRVLNKRQEFLWVHERFADEY